MADKEPLRILLEDGVAAWNAWRRDHPKARLEFIGKDLHDADISGANLQDASLQDSNLLGAGLAGADLERAQLDGADLMGANLRGAFLVEASLSSATCIAIDLTAANLTHALASDCDFTDAVLMAATLEGFKSRGSDFRGVELGICNARNADFSGSRFDRANFSAATLVDANFEQSILYRASLRLADLSGAGLSGADLREVDLSDAKLTEANLAGADLRGARGLTCDALTRAQNWQSAYRDEDLACGAGIPQRDPSPTPDAALEEDPPSPPDAGRLGSGQSGWRAGVSEAEKQAAIEASRAALKTLEAALAGIQKDAPAERETPGPGHNNPPIDDILSQIVPELRAGIALHDAPTPDKAFLSGLRDRLDALAQWLKPRIEQAGENAIHAFGTTIGKAGAYGAVALLAYLTSAWGMLGELVAKLL